MIPVKKSLQTIQKAKLLPIMFASAGIALVITMIFTILVIYYIDNRMIFTDVEWANTTKMILITLVTVPLTAWYILPPIIQFIAGIFVEKVIDKTEKVYYPKKIRKESPKLWPDVLHDIRFTLWVIFLNILITPLHFIVFLGLPASILLNGYLIGREFFENAAGYHIGKPKAKELYKKNTKLINQAGGVIVLLTFTPIVNLFTPIFAVTLMTHIYHQIQKEV